MTVWKLLKDYVREFEIANDCEFSEGAWQRIKQLEADINAIQWAAERDLRALYEAKTGDTRFPTVGNQESD